MTVTVTRLAGSALAAALPALAGLRIEVFRDWPYLYDGSLEYEQRYLSRLAAAKDAVVVIASHGGEIVGGATGCPMVGHADEFAAPFQARGYDVDRIFYFGESVLRRSLRGQGIGHRFFDEREGHARGLERFTHTAFCGVVRPDDHPLRPADYRPLDGFWSKRGYRRVEGLVATFPWKDIDQPGETEKTMQFWMRAL